MAPLTLRGTNNRPIAPSRESHPCLRTGVAYVLGLCSPTGDLPGCLIDRTLETARCSRPGGESARLRLSELIFVEAIRRYLPTRQPPLEGWLAGHGDPAIGRALASLHGEPARNWRLDRLARAAGLSRTVPAERFAQFAGCLPTHHLTPWRMQLAARLLADGAGKVAAVAQAVGDESEAAFSRAFKKATGVAPTARRRRSEVGPAAR